jgi:hypothetical protein
MHYAGIAMSWIAGGESCRGSRGKAALYPDRAAERVHHLPAVRKPNAIAHGRGQYLAAGLVHDLIARRLVVHANTRRRRAKDTEVGECEARTGAGRDYVSTRNGCSWLPVQSRSLVTCPIAFAHNIRLVTGKDAEDPAFQAEWANFPRALGLKLFGQSKPAGIY